MLTALRPGAGPGSVTHTPLTHTPEPDMRGAVSICKVRELAPPHHLSTDLWSRTEEAPGERGPLCPPPRAWRWAACQAQWSTGAGPQSLVKGELTRNCPQRGGLGHVDASMCSAIGGLEASRVAALPGIERDGAGEPPALGKHRISPAL